MVKREPGGGGERLPWKMGARSIMTTVLHTKEQQQQQQQGALQVTLKKTEAGRG